MSAQAISPLPPEVKPDPIVDVRSIVLDAFEQSQSMWRTAEGIAVETGLPIAAVSLALKSLSDSLICSELPDDKGRTRYTTLGNYRAHAGILRRVLSALSDQVR